MKEVSLSFSQIAETAGFRAGPDGKLNLPNTQATADSLAKAAADLMGEWTPGDPPAAVTVTGAGPVWGWLAIAHALHGRCIKLTYSAPNGTIVIWSHGAGGEC